MGQELEAEFLTDSAGIYRRVHVDDNLGGGGDTWELVDTVACQLQAERTRLTQITGGDQQLARALWTCYLPAGTTIDPDYRLQINDGWYEIVETDAPRTRGVLLAVFLARLS